MSKLDKMCDRLEKLCNCWESGIGVKILGVSDLQVPIWTYDPDDMPNEFDCGIFDGDKRFFKFITSPTNNDVSNDWCIRDDGTSYENSLYFHDENNLIDVYFRDDGFASLQLVCLQTYLNATNSELKIPFFLYGEKNGAFDIIKGEITQECVTFER